MEETALIRDTFIETDMLSAERAIYIGFHMYSRLASAFQIFTNRSDGALLFLLIFTFYSKRRNMTQKHKYNISPQLARELKFNLKFIEFFFWCNTNSNHNKWRDIETFMPALNSLLVWLFSATSTLSKAHAKRKIEAAQTLFGYCFENMSFGSLFASKNAAAEFIKNIVWGTNLAKQTAYARTVRMPAEHWSVCRKWLSERARASERAKIKSNPNESKSI